MRSVRGETVGGIVVLAWLAIACGDARAQIPYLVKDLDRGPVASTGFNFLWGSFLPLGHKVLMRGFEPSSGNELWITDGTVLGTGPLADLCPGTCDSNPTMLGVLHGVAFGYALPTELPTAPQQLWRSDGTPRGTYLLPAFLTRGAESAFAGGYLYFTSGNALWRSDGTIPGTRQLDALLPLLSFVGAQDLTAFDDRLYFVTRPNGGNDWALLSTDGTLAGTVLLHDFGSSQAGALTVAGKKLFLLSGIGSGTELWVSDGTAPGTYSVRAFAGGFGDFANDYPVTTTLKAAGDHIYLLGDDGQHGLQVWISDGTSAGTLRLTDFAGQDTFETDIGPVVPFPEEVAGKVVFDANDSTSTGGWQVWAAPISPGPGGPSQTALCGQPCVYRPVALQKVGSRVLFPAGTGLLSTDGTAGGTLEVRCGANACGNMTALVPLLGAVYFATSSTLWRSDGTTAGTVPVAPLAPDLNSDEPFELGALGNEILFNSNSPRSLWITDGTRAGTRQLAGDGELDASSTPGSFAMVGDRLLFTTGGLLEGGTQLWQTRGTPETTSLLGGPAYLQVLAVAGDTAYLSSTNSLDIWTWDPTMAAPTKVTTLPGTEDAYNAIASPAAFLGQLYFALFAQGTPPVPADEHVWKSDGTAAGTGEAFALPAGFAFPANLTPLGNQLYFTSVDPLFGDEVLRSDGTAQGTTVLTQFGSASTGCSPQFTQVGSTVFFVGWDAASGLELWRTDGTAGGTSLVAGATYSNPTELTEHQGAVYFFAQTSGGNRKGLWRSNGTAQGTVELVDLSFGGYGSSDCDPEPNFLTSTGSLLFFVADDGVHGRELWRSDGTIGGTQMVKDISPGPAGSNPTGLVAAGGELFFAADDGVHGIELWRSDGSAAGTRMVADLNPGASSSYPGNLVVGDGRLFFAADDGITGSELWALPLATAGCEASPTVLCVQGNRFAVTVEWEDFAGNTGSGRATALTGDTGTFWFFDPANVEVIVKVLDGRALNGDFWVFYGALSTVRYEITVTDTVTGLSRRYENFAGDLASVADTSAFGSTGAASHAQAAAMPAAARPAASASGGPARRAAGESESKIRPAGVAGAPSAAAGSCHADSHHLCLNGSRFAVEASWTDFSGHSGSGQAVTLTPDTGYFWFFDPANVEVVLKVLDGRAVNGKFWVFYGALSNVQYSLEVTDTLTGAVKIYVNPSGRLASVADTSAF